MPQAPLLTVFAVVDLPPFFALRPFLFVIRLPILDLLILILRVRRLNLPQLVTAILLARSGLLNNAGLSAPIARGAGLRGVLFVVQPIQNKSPHTVSTR